VRSKCHYPPGGQRLPFRVRLIDPEYEQDKNQEDNERQLVVNDPVSHPLSPPPS
jgi:hypothetical protein